MPRHIHLESHLTEDELQKRYRAATDPVERSHWHFLWLLASGLTATAVAAVTGYSAYWIGQIARRYNMDGPDGVRDRHFASIEELENAQAERCVALQARPELIRSTTRFSWWPQRIHRRYGPRRG